jgi:hypothetical protein
VIDWAACVSRAQRFVAQAAQAVRAAAVGGHPGQQLGRQPLQCRGVVSGQRLDELIDRLLPPGQYPLRGPPTRLGQIQGQCPALARPGPAQQPGGLQAIRQADRAGMSQAQRPAQGEYRLARVVGQRHQCGRPGGGQAVLLLFGGLAQPVRHGQGERAEQVGRPPI